MIQGLLALLLLLQAPAPNPKASVEGMVIRGDTGAGIAGAQITLSSSNQADVITFSSDPEGRFAIRDIAPGTYRLFAARNGYARTEYGQRTLNGRGAPITLVAGQTLKDFSLRLIAAGVVVGRVSDSTGEPLTGFSVELLRPEYNSVGKRDLLPVLSAKTDDRGEYRIFWVTPGKYYVDVNPIASGENETREAFRAAEQLRESHRDAGLPPGSRSIMELASLANSNQAISRESFVLTYYPGTADASRAQAVDVKAGNELSGINVQLVRQPLARVRGRVFDAAGQPTGADEEILLRSAEGSRLYSVIRADSTFEIRNVPPGSYTLDASGDNGHAISRIELAGIDVDNVVLTRRPGTRIVGQLRTTDISVEGLSIGLAHAEDPVGRYEVKVNADGMFVFDSVAAGRYWLSLEIRAPSFFLREARVAGTDLLRETLSVSSTSPGVIDLTLSNKPGRVEGAVADQLSRPVGGVDVVLIPTELRHRFSYYRTATTDAAGNFAIENVIPGDYKAFSWEQIEPYSYYEPDFLKKFEQAGAAVRVTETATSTASIKLIPASVQ